MKKNCNRMKAFVGASLFALSVSANAATTIIGGTTANGNFADNFTNSTEGASWGYTAENAGGGSLAVTVNSNGRGLIDNTGTGSQVNLTGWIVERVSYPGGNGSYGLDGGNATFGATPNPYVFVNSGSVNVISSAIPVSLLAGDTISFGADLHSASAGGSITVSLDFGNGETHTYAEFLTTAAAAAQAHSSVDYTLLAPASEVTMTVLLNTEASGNQTLLDNVTLTAVPEPSTALLAGLGLVGLLRRRR